MTVNECGKANDMLKPLIGRYESTITVDARQLWAEWSNISTTFWYMPTAAWNVLDDHGNTETSTTVGTLQDVQNDRACNHAGLHCHGAVVTACMTGYFEDYLFTMLRIQLLETAPTS